MPSLYAMNTHENNLYKILGELGADMKHVLRALEHNRITTTNLRTEVLQETEQLNARLTRVESFNTRVLAYATVFVTVGTPILLALVKWGVPALMEIL